MEETVSNTSLLGAAKTIVVARKQDSIWQINRLGTDSATKVFA